MQKNLTEGSVTKTILLFSLPMIAGNLLQQLYNIADTLIVGRFLGSGALAAVGASYTLMTFLTSIFLGLCMGSGAVFSIRYGEKDQEQLEKSIGASFLLIGITAVIVNLAVFLFIDPILGLLQVPQEIYGMMRDYLWVIFLGILATFLYNFFSSTLRALGDSASPLYFLIISAVLNIFGDLFFVIVLKAGSNGCAISTVLSEALCCLFCIIYIQKKVPILRLGKKWLVFDSRLLKKTIAYGWASAMQQATVQMGKIAIQVLVNTMGVSVAAAFAVVNRIDDFAITPEQNIAHAMTALMAQNKGAGKNDRMREGFRCGMILEIVYGAAVMVICQVFAGELMALFAKDEEVIGHGVIYLHLIAVMYILPAVTNAIQGFFRGIGDLKVTLMSSFTNMAVRVIAAAPMILLWNFGIEALPYSYLAGWVAMLLVETPLMIRIYRKK